MPTLAAPLDFAKLEGRNQRVHQLSTAPSSPVTGQMYYNTTDNTLYWWNNTAWVAASAGAGGPPTGAAGGDLSGTYPNPQILANAIVAGDIANGTITDTQISAANKDGLVGVASMRTLGIGSQQAMAGNQSLAQISSNNVALAAISANSQKIINLADPTASADAATKNYVDGLTQGLDSHPSVKAATTANITLSGNQTVDGVALVGADRCLVKDQTLSQNNGIYAVNVGAWTRVADQDAWAEVPSAYVWVEQGTVNGDSGWVSTADAGGTLGTTPMPWVQFSGAGQITAGAGLTKTGNTLDVVGAANRITVNADNIDIAATYVGQGSIVTVGTITTGAWAGTPIPIVNGGTGQITAPAARSALGAAGVYTSATHGAGATISITAATHGLTASRGLLVQCQIDATGAVILPDVSVAANGDVTVTFSVSQSANTIRTTIIG